MGAYERNGHTASSATGYPTEARVAGRLLFGERVRGGSYIGLIVALKAEETTYLSGLVSEEQ
jgi:hypothetical protein